jgi:hypothetical protein
MAVFWVVASTSETSVKFYQTTRCNNPEDSHLHTRRENLKSQRELGSCGSQLDSMVDPVTNVRVPLKREIS